MMPADNTGESCRGGSLDCEVLVVGAGPTGLMAANLLRRSGVDVRIVEKRATASRESRAFAVQARSLELMLSLGLADEFMARGVIATGIDIHVRGKRRGGLNLDLANAPDTPFQYIMMIPQSETEAILIDDLADLGVDVERDMTVTAVAQDETGVTTSVSRVGGATVDIRSAYVVGADGSRSIVRSNAGLAFEGGSYAQSFLLADCRVDWPLDHQRFRVFINGRRIGLFLPLDGSNLSRVMATDLSGGNGDATEPAPLDLAEIQAGFSEATGISVQLGDPVWVTRYRAHHRAVDCYRAGRIFVAGDAAHIHSPAGGQGMNTGLQDAANLAWKVAAVLRRGADDDLLDSYHDERQPVGQQVVKSTGKLFSATAGQAGWKASIRDRLAVPALKIISNARPIQRKAFLNISQRKLSYSYGPYVGAGEGVRRWRGGPAAGERAPNASISRATDMFDLLRGYRFVVLALSRKPLDSVEVDQVQKELDRISKEAEETDAYLVARVARGRDPRGVFVNTAEPFDRYGIKGRDDQGLYIIRPDGYVAWRCYGFDFDACRRFLARFRAPV